MVRSKLPTIGLALTVMSLSPLHAAETNFAYKTSYRRVTADPDGIWTGGDLAIGPKGTVTIHEYELRTPGEELLVSQIWNEDCASGTCPTRLVRIRDGRPTVLVDDMMHQIIPPDDPRFADVASNKAAAQFAQHPFALGDGGKTLINGDYKFPLDRHQP